MTLNPTAGVETVEGLLEELGPVADGASEHAAKDKVEFVVVCPFIFEVVDLEFEVCWKAGLLVRVMRDGWVSE